MECYGGDPEYHENHHDIQLPAKNRTTNIATGIQLQPCIITIALMMVYFEAHRNLNKIFFFVNSCST